jgi:hypothetical protein
MEGEKMFSASGPIAATAIRFAVAGRGGVVVTLLGGSLTKMKRVCVCGVSAVIAEAINYMPLPCLSPQTGRVCRAGSLSRRSEWTDSIDRPDWAAIWFDCFDFPPKGFPQLSGGCRHLRVSKCNKFTHLIEQIYSLETNFWWKEKKECA